MFSICLLARLHTWLAHSCHNKINFQISVSLDIKMLTFFSEAWLDWRFKNLSLQMSISKWVGWFHFYTWKNHVRLQQYALQNDTGANKNPTKITTREHKKNVHCCCSWWCSSHMQDYGFCFVNFELFWIWKLIFFFFWPPSNGYDKCLLKIERERKIWEIDSLLVLIQKSKDMWIDLFWNVCSPLNTAQWRTKTN